MAFDAIVVLGCRVHGPELLSGAASRRVARAAQAYREGLSTRVLASGGKLWGGTAEATAMAARLAALGVPRDRILCEDRSQTTVQNARFVAELARRSNLHALCVVTCDWHMRRAVAAFRREGFEVHPVCAQAPLSRTRRLLRRTLERLHTALDSVVARVEKLGPANG